MVDIRIISQYNLTSTKSSLLWLQSLNNKSIYILNSQWIMDRQLKLIRISYKFQYLIYILN